MLLELTKERIIIKLPMPPQSNNMYVGARLGRRFPSKQLTAFKSQIQLIKLGMKLDEDQKGFKTQFINIPIKLHRKFYFHYSSVFTKKNTVKRMDVSNRIKACDDALEVLFGIDDAYVFFASEEKCISTTDEAFVMLVIERYN